MTSVNITRRQALKGSLVLPLMPSVSSAAASAETSMARHDGTVLVAYFTRTGNTRLIATQIARALDAPLFQIVPAVAYPEDYEAQAAQAEDERQRGYEPPLKATVPDMGSYRPVFLASCDARPDHTFGSKITGPRRVIDGELAPTSDPD